MNHTSRSRISPPALALALGLAAIALFAPQPALAQTPSIQLSGVPTSPQSLEFAGAAMTYTITVVPSNTNLNARAQVNAVVDVDIAATGTAGEWTLIVTPPTFDTTALTDTVTITATDPADFSNRVTETIDFVITLTVRDAAVISGLDGLTFAPDTSAFNFGDGARTFNFKVSPDTVPVSISSATSTLFETWRLAEAGVFDEMTKRFTPDVPRSYTLTVKPAGTDPAVGYYSETLTITATEDGRTPATQELTFTITPPANAITITNLVADTTPFDFGDAASTTRTVTFNVAPDTATFTVASDNNVFTVAKVLDSGTARSFTVTPPATDPDTGTYSDTVTITVGVGPTAVTQQLRFTINRPTPTITFSGLAATQTLPFGGTQNVRFSVNPRSSVLTYSVSPTTTPPLVVVPGAGRFTQFSIQAPATDTGTTTYTITVSATATGYADTTTDVTVNLTAALTQQVVLSGAPITDPSVSLEYGAAATEYTITAVPTTATLETIRTTGAVGASIAPAASGTAGEWTLTLTPPSTGTVLTDTVRITATAADHITATHDIAVTVTPRPATTFSAELTGFDASPFEFGDEGRLATFTVSPATMSVTISPATSDLFSLWDVRSVGSGKHVLSIQPLATDPGTSTSYSETVTITATEDGRASATQELTFTINPSPIEIAGLPDSALTRFEYSGAAQTQTYTFTVTPAAAAVAFTATAAGGATNGVAASVAPRGTTAGEYTLTITAPTADTGIGPYTDRVTVTATDTAGVRTTARHTMTVRLAFTQTSLSGVPTDTQSLEYAADPTTYTITVTPPTIRLAASSTGVVGAIISTTGTAGTWTLTVTPPSTGTTLTDTVTITARDPNNLRGLVTDTIAFTITPRAAATFVGLDAASNTDAFNFGDTARDITFSVNPAAVPISISPTSSNLFSTWNLANNGAGTYTLTIQPPAEDPLTATSYSETLTVTATEDGRTDASQELVFTINPSIELTGLPARTRPFIFDGTGDTQTFTFTVSPATATFTATVAGAATNGLTAAVTGTGADRTLTVTAPATDNGEGPYTDTVTVTASTGFTDVTHDLAITLTPAQITLSGVPIGTQTGLEYGATDTATYTITVNPPTIRLEASSTNNAVATIVETGTAGTWTLTVTPPSTGSRLDTVTITATDPAGLRTQVTNTIDFSFTARAAATFGGLDAAGITDEFGFGDVVRTIPFSVSPDTVSVSISPSSSTLFSTWGLANNGNGSYTLTLQPVATDPGTGTYSETLTIDATEDGRSTATERLTFTIDPSVIRLTGLPDTATTSFAFSGTNRVQTFPFTVTPTDATFTATVAGGATNGLTAAVTGTGVNRTLTITAPTTDSGSGPYTDRVTVTASATGLDNVTHNLVLTLTPTPLTLTGLPDTATTSFTFSDPGRTQTFDFTVTPANTTVTFAALATNGIVTASVAARGINPGDYTLTVTAPATDSDDSRGYSDTVTVTASLAGRADVSHALALTLTPEPITLAFPADATDAFAFGEGAREIDFDIFPTGIIGSGSLGVTVSDATLFESVTVEQVDIGTWRLSLSPPATDPGSGPYTETLTIRVAHTGNGARAAATEDLAFTIDNSLTQAVTFPQALPTSIGPLAFTVSTLEDTFTVSPSSATVTAVSVDGVLEDVEVVGTGASRTLRYRRPTPDGATAFADTIRVTATEHGYIATIVEIPVTFIEPARRAVTVEYAGTSTYTITADPTTADLSVVSSDSVVGASIAVLDRAAGTWTLTLTAPTTGTILTDTVTITATGSTRVIRVIVVTVTPRPVATFAGLDAPSNTAAFEFGDGVRTINFSVDPTTVPVTISPASSTLFNTWNLADNGGGNYALTIQPISTDPGTGGTYYSETLTITATEDGRETAAEELTFTITTVPAAPTDVALTPGNGRLTVSWTAVPPANNGGSAILTYTATATDTTNAANTFTCTATDPAATGCTGPITDLTNGVEYSVEVIATNSAGNSLPSTAETATLASISTDATLATLSVAPFGGTPMPLTLTPTFAAGTTVTAYEATAPSHTTASVQVMATATDGVATIEYVLDDNNGIFRVSAGENILTVRVTAEDGTTTIDYIITVTVPADPAITDTAQQTQEVPSNWELIPDQDGVDGADFGPGESFRLLFITSGSGRPNSSDISSYNDKVQNAASGGHVSIRAFSNKFRALVTTETVDARDNTGTNRVTDNHLDAPIYWLNGTKLADNYADFYDADGWARPASADRHALLRNENGLQRTGSSGTLGLAVWTGSARDGTLTCCSQAAAPATSTGGATATVRVGRPASEVGNNPIAADIVTAAFGTFLPTYGLSPVFTVQSTDASLSALDVNLSGGSAVTLTQPDGTTTGFAASVFTYTATATVPSVPTTVTVAAMATETGASIQYAVGDPLTATFANSGDLTVNTGENTLTVRVTAEDDMTRQDYTITLTVRQGDPVDLTGLPDEFQRDLTFGGSAAVFTLTADPTDATVTAVSDNGVVTVAIVDNGDGTHMVTVTPPSTGDVYTDTVTITATDPSGARSVRTEVISYTAFLPQATIGSTPSAITTQGFPDAYEFGGEPRSGDITISPASVDDVTITSRATGGATTGLLDASIVRKVGGAADEWTITITPRPITADPGTHTLIYTVSFEIVATEENRHTAKRTFSALVKPAPITLSGLPDAAPVPFTFGGAAQTFTFTLVPPDEDITFTATVSHASADSAYIDAFTAEVTGTGADRTLTVTAPSDDNSVGPYNDITVTVTATDADRTPSSATHEMTVSLTPEPISLSGLPTPTEATLTYTQAAVEYDITVFPITATLTATSPDGVLTGVAIAEKVGGADGEWTLTVTPPTVAGTRTDTVTITATDPSGLRTQVSETIDFTINLLPAVTVTGLDALTTPTNVAPFTFGASARLIDFTTTPADVTVNVATVISSPDGTVISNQDDRLFTEFVTVPPGSAANEHRYSIMPPATDDGTGPYANTTTFTITADLREPYTTALTFTIDSVKDASLSVLSVTPSGGTDALTLTQSDGTTTGFAGAFLTYTATASVGTTAVAVVATPNDGAATYTITGTAADGTDLSEAGGVVSGLTTGDNVITVTVTSEDTTIMRVYTITLTVLDSPLGITIADAVPGTLDFGGNAQLLTLTLTPADASATFNAVSANNLVTATVTGTSPNRFLSITPVATDPGTGTYTDTVTLTVSSAGRADATADVAVTFIQHTDATLSALRVTPSGGSPLSLTPAFAAGTTAYTATAPTMTTTVTIAAPASVSAADVAIAGFAADDTTVLTVDAATGVVSGLTVGNNTITITVTAVDGSTNTYTVTLTRAADATLNALSVTSGGSPLPLTPAFAAGTFAYTATAPIGTATVTIDATANGAATFTIAGTAADTTGLTVDAATGVVSGLTVGDNTITITVTNGGTTNIYTITLTRAADLLTFGGNTIDDQTYQAATDITPLVLPAATGGTGTLAYTLTPDAATIPGLTFAPATRTLSGNPTATVTQTLTYTVTDSAAPTPTTAALAFDLMVVRETNTTPATTHITLDIDGDNAASDPVDLAPDATPSDSEDGILTLPTGHGVTAVAIGAAPQAAIDAPPTGITFALTTDIAIEGTLTADATICLPTTAVPPGRMPTLYHDTSGGGAATWTAIGTDTTRSGYVCGTTATFSPLAVGFAADVTVTRVTSASGTFNSGNRIIVVRVSEAVTATGAPQLALVGGRTASFRRVRRGTELLFVYPVAANDNVAELAYTGINALTLPDGVTIQSTAGAFDADLTLPVPGTPNSLSGSSDVALDTIAPVFTCEGSCSDATGFGAVNSPLDVIVYNADATDNGTFVADAEADTGVTYTLSGPDAGMFSIDEATGHVTFAAAQPVETTHNIVITATDMAGNATDLAVTIPVFAAPVVTITDDISGIATDRVTFTFTWSEPVTGFGLGSIGRSPPGIVSLRTVTPGRVYTLEYTVASSAHNGTIRIRVLANAVTGTLTNAGNAETTATQRYDNVAPAFAAATDAATYLANSPIDTVVYDASATDGGAADSGVTYSLGGTDADLFDIVPASGIVTYKAVQPDVATHDITITATDKGGNTDTVAVTVTIAIPSTDATLRDLSALSVTPFGALTLSPDFVTATTAYATTAQAGATAVLVSATATHAGASVQYAMGANPADDDFTDSGTRIVAVGDNVLTARVTAEDRIATQDYIITLTVPAAPVVSTDVTLSALTVTPTTPNGGLTPDFAAATTVYVATAPAGTTAVTVDATANDTTGASVQYAVGFNPADAWFKDSGIKPVVDGANVITVRVTAGGMMQDYTISLNVLLPAARFSALPSNVVTTASDLSDAYNFGGDSRSGDFTVDPATVDVTIESPPPAATSVGDLFDVSVVRKVGGPAGTWTITITPPSIEEDPGTAATAYVEAFRLISSEAGRADREIAFVAAIKSAPITLTGLPDVVPTPFTFGGANQTQTFPFTLAPPGDDITFTATAANAANTGLAAAVTGTGASRTLTVTAPDSDNGGPYSDTITVTASADGRTDVSHEMTVILGDGPIRLSALPTVSTLLDFGGPAQNLTFTLTTNAITTFTLSADSANNLVTAAITGTPSDRVLSITPVATDPDAGTYIDTVTLTVSSPGLPDVTADVSVMFTQHTDATLSALNISPSFASPLPLSPAFTAATTAYTVEFPLGTRTMDVAATATTGVAGVQYAVGNNPTNSDFGDSDAFLISFNGTSLHNNRNLLTVRVTAGDGTTQDYVITLALRDNTVTDATLFDLTVTSTGGTALTLTPAFAAATMTYAATVLFGTTTVTVDATMHDSAATVAITGTAADSTPLSVTSGVVSGLTAGENVITVTVTAEDTTTTRDYTIRLNVRATASDDADLRALTVTTGGTALTLSPAFAAATTTYTATAPSGTTSVTVLGTKNDFGAEPVQYAVGNNPVSGDFTTDGDLTVAAGENLLTVRVTAEDDSTQDYTIMLTVQASTDANLSALRFVTSDSVVVPLDQTFAAATTTYTATAPFGATSVTVFATPTYIGADVRYAVGNNPVSGDFTTSNVVSGLTAGENVITVRVTAEDDSTRDYTTTLTVRDTASDDADLRALTVTTGGTALTLSPDFAAATTTYTATAPRGTTSVTVLGTKNDFGAERVRYAVGNDPVSGDFTTSGFLTVDPGENLLTARVTAEDTTTTRDYTITLTVQTSMDANLRELTVTTSDGTAVTFEQTFAAATTAYTATAPGGTTSVTVAATENDAVGASVQYAFGGSPMDDAFGDSGTFTVSSAGENVLTVRVTAEDDTTTQDYTITLTVPVNTDATLSKLSITPGGFSPRTLCHLPCRGSILTTGFASGTTGYALSDSVPLGTTSIIVAATANDATGASVKYAIGIGSFTNNGFSETSRGPFVASGVFAVSPGAYNTFTVRVTAEDSSTQEYTIRAWVPTTTEANNPAQQTQKVSRDWPLIPDNVGPGESFRLLFITSGTFRTSSDQPVSSFISNYNAFVQSAANDATGAGAPIADFSAKFRALVTTPTTDARDNTGTNRVTRTHADAPIYWLNGAKVADNYADFYDSNGWDRSGSEDPHARLRNEHGVTHGGGSSGNTGIRVWTGSARDGTETCCGQDAYPVSDNENALVAYGQPASSLPSLVIRAGQTSDRASRPIYALSPRITVAVPSADATLRTLSVITGGAALTMTQSGGTTTGFDGTVLAYTATAALGTTMVTMTAVATDTTNAGVQYAVGDPSTAVFTDGGVKTVAGGDNVLTVRVTAEDGTTRRDYRVTLNVDVPFVPTPLSLPAFSNRAIPSVGLTRTYTLPEADGGTPPYTYTLTRTDGTGTPVLPPGMTFNATARTISGAATQPYNGRLRYAVTDANGDNVFTEFTLGVLLGNVPSQTYNVGERVDLTLPGASAALTGPFTYTLTRSGGTPVLPPGLAFDATAHTITGAPTAAFGGDLGAPLDYVITDANGETESYLFSLTVTSSDATLSTLTVTSTVGTALTLTQSDGTTTDFDAAELTYTATAPAGTTNVTVEATATDDGARILYAVGDPSTATFAAGGALAVSAGDNTLTVRVIAADSSTMDYTIALTVLADATLSALRVTTGESELTLTQSDGTTTVFDAAELTYTATAPGGTTSVTVAATATDTTGARVVINGTAADGSILSVTGDAVTGLTAGDNVITVTVTAADGTTTLDYIITLTVPLNTDATLSDLSVTAGVSMLSLTQSDGTTTGLAAGEFTYTATARVGTTTVTVAATATDDANADVQYAVGANPADDAFDGSGTNLAVAADVDNILTVRVTPEDPMADTQDYTIILTVRTTASSDATLSNLIVTTGGSALTLTQSDGTTTAFAAAELTYTATALAGTTTVTVVATATDTTGASVAITVADADGTGLSDILGVFSGLTTGNNVITVTVTAEDRSTQNYIITLTVPLNTDATLSGLSVTPSVGSALTLTQSNGTTTGFAADEFTYTATAPAGTTSVTVATATDTGSRIAITGTAADGSTLSVTGGAVTGLTTGDNVITVTVTAEDGMTTQDYTITLTVPSTVSTDATLSELTVTPSGESELTLTQSDGTTTGFAADEFTYTATALVGTTFVTVAATATDMTGAGVQYAVGMNPADSDFGNNGTNLTVSPGSNNVLTVRVTAEDGMTTQDYTITLTVRTTVFTEATLSELTVTPTGGSALTLTPAFTAATTAYTATAPAGTTSVTVVATATDTTGASIQYAVGAAPASGDFNDGGDLTVSSGDNVLTVRVTAENDTTTLDYIITLTVSRNTDATLSALNVTPTGGTALTLTQSDGTTTGFATATTAYTATAPAGTTSVTVAAMVTDTIGGAGVQYAVGDPSTATFTDSGALDVVADDNVLTARVTAEDGTTLDYTITLTVPVVSSPATLERLNEQVLSRATQAIAAGTLAAMGARVEAAAGGFGSFGGSGAVGNLGETPKMAYRFGGQSSLDGLLKSHGESMLRGEMEVEQLLDGASFVMPLSVADSDGSRGGSAGLSLWGSSDYRSLSDDTDDLDWDGKIVSGHLGVDGPISERMLAGFALSWNRGNFDYSDKSGGAVNATGDYEYSATNLHPYIGWLPHDGLRLWGTAGYGVGEIKDERTSNGNLSESTAETEQSSLAGGFIGRVASSADLLSGGVTTLNLKGDISLVWVDVNEDEDDKVAAQSIDTRRMRLLLSGEYERTLSAGELLAPSLEVGIRHDAGEGLDGDGVEVGTGLRYANPDRSLRISGNVRTLLSHDYDEWGADLSVRLSPQSGRGLLFSVSPVWGKTQSAAERLWDDGIDELIGDDTDLHRSLDTEIGYGLGAMMLGSPGILTPYAGMTTDSGGSERVRLGGRFLGGNGFSLNLESVREKGAAGGNHTVLLRGEVAF